MARPYFLFWDLAWCLVPFCHILHIRGVAPKKFVQVVEQDLPLLLPPLPLSFDKNVKFPFLLLYLVYSFVTCVRTVMGIYIYKVSGCSSSRRSSLTFRNRGNRPSSSALAHLHHSITLVGIATPILSEHITSEMCTRCSAPPPRPVGLPLVSLPFC